MLFQMGSQETTEGQVRIRYERLNGGDEKVGTPKRRWVRRVNGRVIRGIRLSRARKLNWKAFSLLFFPRRIAGLYADIVKRIVKMDGVYPGIIFSCQWGLPVLSHPSVNFRKSALSFHQKPAFSDIMFAK